MTDVRDGERNYDKSSVEVTFFKSSGKYYTHETIELPEELRGSIDISQPGEQDAAANLIYERRKWLSKALENRYVGMHAVSLDSDVIGFPMMIVRSGIDSMALLNIADKLEDSSSDISLRMRLPESPEQDGQWFLPQSITHTSPDTQRRIYDDASLSPDDYCAMRGIHVASGGGYDYQSWVVAMVSDLLRRQRELDARTMGGAR